MRLLITIVLLLNLLSCVDVKENELWLNDFEVLKQELTKGYANLKFAYDKEGIDLSYLNASTIVKLQNAKTKEDAQKIIIAFIKTFNDGHLKAKIFKTKQIIKDSDNTINTSKETNKTTLVTLKQMGFQKIKSKNRILYDSIKTYTAIKTSNLNPFKTAIIKSPKGNIGILKIESFGYWKYWNVAFNILNSNKSELQNNESKLMQAIDNQLTTYLIEIINSMKREKISSLIIDVSSNGGGTEWCEEVARLFTAKDLKGIQSFFVKHNLWKSILENHIALINEDLKNPKLNPSLKLKLQNFKALVNGLLVEFQNNYSLNAIWKKNDLTSLNLLHHPYASELPFEIMKDTQFPLLNSKFILNTSRYIPFKTGLYNGPLFIVQDRYSGSATEQFSSLLQLNNVAKIIGEKSYGAGCGYNNGGIEIKLHHIELSVKMPDCVRLRKDGKNEIFGIIPDIELHWNEHTNPHKKGKMVIQAVMENLK